MTGTLIVTGVRSKIITELATLTDFHVVGVGNFPPSEHPKPWRYIFAQGQMNGEPFDMSRAVAMYETNAAEVAWLCEKALGQDDHARICVIGSMSGIWGSFDTGYAMSKAALHLYVRTRLLKQHQQLVAVAPWIIGDAGMTTRRPDQDRLSALALAHPKRRFITCAEVARTIQFLLFEDHGYITNTVIEMHGGRTP